VASKSQRKATSAHRRRAAARGLVRLEVQAPRKDVEPVRTVVKTLRGEPEKAKALRSAPEEALVNLTEMTAFDICLARISPMKPLQACSTNRVNEIGGS